MNIDKAIKWLMPKEERFHELLEKATKNLLLGAQVFSEIAHATSLEDRKVKGVQLKALEREGDGITRQIFEALNTTFITPFDREDIRSLASDLDDVLDHLESVAKYLVLFELAEAPEALRRFAVILSAMAVEIDKLRVLIWDMGNLQTHPGVDGPDLGAREPGRLALLHRDLRALPEGLRGVDRDPEVEGSLRGPRGGLRPLQGLHARRRQRRRSRTPEPWRCRSMPR